MIENRMLIDSEWEREDIDLEEYEEHLREEDDRRYQDKYEEELLDGIS